MPLILALADRVAAGSRRAWLGLAAAVGAMLLAGYPVFVSDTGLLLAVIAVASWAVGSWQLPPQRAWPILAAAFAVGGLLAAPQILAAAATLAESGRTGLADRHAGVFERAITLHMLGPMLVGIPSLLLLGLGALRRREAWPALAGLLFALAMLAGGWKLLRLVPGLGAVRHPLTWAFIAQFPLAWWIAAGVDALERDARGTRVWLSVAALAWTGFVLVHWLGPGDGWAAPEPARPAAHLAAGPVGGLGLAGALGLVAASGWLVAAWSAPGLRRLALAGGTVAAVLAQIAAFPFGIEQDVFDRPDHPLRTRNLLADRPDGRILSVPDASFGFSARDRVENLMGVEASLMPPRFRALETGLGFDVFSSHVPWPELATMPGLLDALDVSHLLVTRKALRGFEPGWTRTSARHERHRLIANGERPGRAWVVYGVHRAGDLAAAIERVSAPDFDPTREVVLESPTRRSYPARADTPATPASVRQPAPTRVEIDVELPRPGVLVLADACHSGWRARVDGEPADWQCANAVTRALELDAGRHRVEFDFDAGAVHAGLGVAGLTAAAMLAAAVMLREGRSAA